MIAPTQQTTPTSLAQAPIPQADAERKEQMKLAWKSYRGEFPDALKVEKDQPNDNVKNNRCGPIVDKGVSFLFGQVLKIEATDEQQDDESETPQSSGTSSSDKKPSPIQECLDGMWGDDDDKMTLLSQMAINGAVCGECFVKLIPAQDEMKYPRIVVMDPMLVRIVTAPDDCTLTLAYVIEYPGTNDLQKRQIIARVDTDLMAGIAGEYDLDDTWTITNYVRKGQVGVWLQVGTPEVWPYPFAPILCNQNLPNPNEPWGRPDLTPDLIEMNKVLNFLMSSLSRIIKYHGHPVTYATGLRSSEISIAINDLLCLPSENSKIEKLAPMDNFAGLLSCIEDIRSSMDEQSRVPAVALGRLHELPKGNISGVALQLLFQPLIEKTILKRRVYGRLIREVSRAGLVLSGKLSIEEYEQYEIGLHWADLLPIDDLAAAQAALLYKQLGVSDSTILQQLGYDPDAEASKSAKEDQKKLKQAQQFMPAGQPPLPGQPGAQPGMPPPPNGGNQATQGGHP